MKYIILILLLIMPSVLFAELKSKEEWIAVYIKPCPQNKKHGIQCRENTIRMFKELARHRSMIIKRLDKNGLQRWLGMIPIVESQFGYYEVSRSGAVGLFQIMPSNLVHYLTTRWSGLNYEYERKPKLRYAIKQGKNPKISTDIACRMLSDLYKKYGKRPDVKKKDLDKIVVMAYNAGETRVNNWLKGEGKPLRAETLNYYFQLLALNDILEDIRTTNGFGLR